jgi:hypothetical protein
MAFDDMLCPCCDGTMTKQKQYFWLCTCGAEFWPDEATVPDDPDQWAVTSLARQSGQGDALALISKLHSEGLNAAEIAAELNEAGHRTPRGVEWARTNLLNYMRRHGVLSDNYANEREKILEIVEAMAGKQGVTCKTIAERLNREGYKTSRNQPWSMASVLKLVRSTLKLDINLYRTDALLPAREKTGKGKGGQDHPWAIAEHARIERNREWQRNRLNKEGKK